MTADLIGINIWHSRVMYGIISQLYLEQIWTAPDTDTQMPTCYIYIRIPNYQYAPPPRPQCLKVSSPVIALCVYQVGSSSNMHSPVAEFIVPDWGDKVNTGIGLSYRPTRLHRLCGPVCQPYAGVDYIPQSGTMNLASVEYHWPAQSPSPRAPPSSPSTDPVQRKTGHVVIVAGRFQNLLLKGMLVETRSGFLKCGCTVSRSSSWI